jgi:putative transcriptional regulator
MLRFRLKELIAEKNFGRTGSLRSSRSLRQPVHRMTLSKLANHRGYNPTGDVLDKLCAYFRCRIEQLVEHIPDDQVTGHNSKEGGGETRASDQSRAGRTLVTEWARRE